VFLTFLEAKNLSKFLVHLRAFIFFHEKSKNSDFPQKEISSKSVRQVACASGRKTCFLGQKFENCKNCLKFLEIWGEYPSLNVVLGQGSLSQDLESILIFSLP